MNIIKTNKNKESSQDARQEAQELLITLIKKLVDTPDDIKVEMLIGEQTTVYKIHPSMENTGQILGKQGKTIAALRQLIFAIMAKHGVRTVIEIPFNRK